MDADGQSGRWRHGMYQPGLQDGACAVHEDFITEETYVYRKWSRFHFFHTIKTEYCFEKYVKIKVRTFYVGILAIHNS